MLGVLHMCRCPVQAALTFLPAAKGKDVSPCRAHASLWHSPLGTPSFDGSPAFHIADLRADELETRELAQLLLFVGSCAGIAGGLLSAGLPLVIPQAFTQDVALHPIMRSVLPQVSVASDLAIGSFAMFAAPL
jgi:hypothetical protein